MLNFNFKGLKKETKGKSNQVKSIKIETTRKITFQNWIQKSLPILLILKQLCAN